MPDITDSDLWHNAVQTKQAGCTFVVRMELELPDPSGNQGDKEA
jgi:hypothetical protein